MGKPKMLLKTLYNILQVFTLIYFESSEFKQCIEWTQNGKAFLIRDADEFQKIMPDYFSSTQIKSLYRQLNSYGFKMRSLESKQKLFSHKWFSKGNFQSIQKITRKNESEHQCLNNANEIQIMRESTEALKKELEQLQLQQSSLLKQLRIHTQIQTLVCRNILRICSQMKKQDIDIQSDYEKRFEMFFRSMIDIFKGFEKDIAISIMTELRDIGGPLTPALSPLLFPYFIN